MTDQDITREQLDHFLKDFQYLCDQHEIYMSTNSSDDIGLNREKLKYSFFHGPLDNILDWDWEDDEETSLSE